MHTLLISDLHLCASRPQTTELLLNFLATTARTAGQLYVLGDLFDAWVGDDDGDDPHHARVAAGFRALTAAGTQVGWMHGNRDFLLGERFAAQAGASLLHDPLPIRLHGRRALLTHGDALCTDDAAYQEFRTRVRNRQWQQDFLAQPLAIRKAQATALRKRSEAEKTTKPAAIMDVNPQAVEALLRAQDYPELLIHGHTHRPALHHTEVDGRVCQRWVLADWQEKAGDYLRCDETGCVRGAVLPGSAKENSG